MDRKYLNSVLIVLLVVIWGGVIYKHFGGKNISKKNMDISNVYLKTEYNHIIAKDTFLLEFKVGDPFRISGKSIKPTKKLQTIVNKTIKIQRTQVLKNIVWPNITYHGFVKGENNTTRLILLKIDNRLYRKREKEQVKDIRLVKAFNDSLEVSLNGNNKIITRQ